MPEQDHSPVVCEQLSAAAMVAVADIRSRVVGRDRSPGRLLGPCPLCFPSHTNPGIVSDIPGGYASRSGPAARI